MANKNEKEFLNTVKDKAESVVDAAKPVVEKAILATVPAVKKVKSVTKPAADKAIKAGNDAAQAVVSTAKKVTPQKAEIFVQYGGREISMNELVNLAKDAFRAENKRAAVATCRIYFKPEDNAAYYVINDSYFGRIDV